MKVKPALLALLLFSLGCDGSSTEDPSSQDLGDLSTQPDLSISLDRQLPDRGTLDLGSGDVKAPDLGPLDSQSEDLQLLDAQPEDLLPLDAYAPLDPPPSPTQANLESKAQGFKLYYHERVERALLAFNRFGSYGDLDFASVIGNVFIRRQGDHYELVPGPKDNNLIGTSIWTTWQAYRLFRSRTIELSLIRMLRGFSFFEGVTGVPGLTSREVYPGWTLEIQGGDGPVSRTRFGAPASSPLEADQALRDEIQSTFFEGLEMRYRLNPAEFYFNFSPLAQLEDYTITYSFSELPSFLRNSDCCSSLLRTPEGYPWAGAFWGNHNSRDNFPDLALGALAAWAIQQEPQLPEDLREAAEAAWSASQRIGDLIELHGGSLMTIDEYHDYGELIIGGTLRPHGEREAQDLGSLATCSMVYLAQSLSTRGLSLPAPMLPMPGASIESTLSRLGDLITCNVPEGPPLCRRLDQAYCGFRWATFEELEFMGQPLFEFLRAREESNPGSAESVLAGFQNDYDDVVEAMLALLLYGQLKGDEELEGRARMALTDMTTMMRIFGDLSWGNSAPHRQVEQRYEAALFEAQAGINGDLHADLGDFERAEAQMVRIEALLQIPESSTPPALLSDEEIQARVEARLPGVREIVAQRYREEYGDQPPVRRTPEGYEARGVPLAENPWHPVENISHRRYGSLKLFQALPLCLSRPDLLDCSWAILGCARPDLDQSGGVDAQDQVLFQAAREVQAEGCAEENGWCGGADLDHSAVVDLEDESFMEAAQGCQR